MNDTSTRSPNSNHNFWEVSFHLGDCLSAEPGSNQPDDHFKQSIVHRKWQYSSKFLSFCVCQHKACDAGNHLSSLNLANLRQMGQYCFDANVESCCYLRGRLSTYRQLTVWHLIRHCWGSFFRKRLSEAFKHWVYNLRLKLQSTNKPCVRL